MPATPDPSPASFSPTAGKEMCPHHAFPSRRERDRALSAILRRDDVVVTAQLRGLGYSSTEIGSLVSSGALTRIHHGVYLDGRTRPGAWTRLKAAARAVASDSAFLSHRTAAAARGFRAINTREIHVSVVAEHTPKISGLILHRTTPPEAGEVTAVSGVRVATAQRILTDLAAVGASDTELRDLISAAERRNALSNLETILDSHRGERGVRRLRALLVHHIPARSHNSGLEDEFWEWYATEPDLPAPDETNVRVGSYEFDGLWHRQRLILEIDSRDYHQAKQDMDHDRLKDIFVQKQGLRIIRITGDRFRYDRPGIRDDLLHFLAA